MAVAAVAGMAGLVLEHGFLVEPATVRMLHVLQLSILGLFVLHRITRVLLDADPLRALRRYALDFALIGLLGLSFLFLLNVVDTPFARTLTETFRIGDVAYLYALLAQGYLVASLLLSGVRASSRLADLNIRPALLLLLSFIAVIALGTGLLLLPRSGTAPLGIVDALFTATSATCVTGLSVVDITAAFSGFGHGVLLVLMQVGGLGIMTFTTFAALLLPGGIGLRERVLLRDMLSEENAGSAGRLLTGIVLLTVAVEGAGAALLYLFWGPGLPATGFDRLFFSVFHAVSAFCNGGLSLLREGLADPRVAGSPAVLLTVAGLITLGGIGFLPLTNLLGAVAARARRRRPPVRLRIHTRLVLAVSGVLVAAGTLVVFLLERGNTLAGLSPGEQLLHSLFHAVTARTAGFNTLDVGALLAPTALLTMILMFIGASPGSTGGGIKTTTFALGFFAARALAGGRDSVEIFRRTVAQESVLRALVIILLSLGVVASGILALTLTEDAPFLDIAFEVVSAFATVGLSRGITPELTDAGKLVLCVCMVIGRVGTITVALAVLRRRERADFQYPTEHILTS